MDFESIIKKHTSISDNNAFLEISKKHGISYNVDNDYINDYLNEANTLFSSVSKDYDGLSFGNSSSVSEKNILAANEIKRKANYIKGYLTLNRTSLSEENYNQLLKIADSGYKNASSVAEAFESVKKYYSRWESEEDYNNWTMNNITDFDEDSKKQRLDIYNANANKIAEIEKEIESLKSEGMRVKSFIETGGFGGGGGREYKKQAEIDALKTELEKIRNANNIYERFKKLNDEIYSNYLSAEDFEQNSNYVSRPEYIENWKDPNILDSVGAYQRFLDYYHKGPKLEDHIYKSSDGKYDVADEYWSSARSNGWNYATEKEFKTLNYIANTQGDEAAQEYFNNLSKELSYRRYVAANAKSAEEYQNAKWDEKIGLNIASIPQRILGAVNQGVGMGIGLVTDSYDPYNFAATEVSRMGEATMENTAQELNELTNNGEFLGITLGDAYQAGMSGIDSAVGSLMFGPAYSAIMGMGTAADTARDLYERGATQEQIALGGVLAGTAEAAFEKVSIEFFLENFIKSPNKNFGEWFLKSLAQRGIEMSEEMVTEIANIMSDAMVMGSQSEWEKLLTNYKNSGYSDSAAISKALMDMGGRVWKAGASGFISGGSMSDVAGGISLLTNRSNTRKNDNTTNKNTNFNSNVVTNPIESYPAEKQNTIKSFINSVDGRIKSFVESVKGGDLTFRRVKISDVSSRAANDIKNLLGIDVSGYTHNINTNGIQHILKRHGENGEANTTMSADEDIARVGWVLDNYDSVELLTDNENQVVSGEFRDKNDRPASQIRYIKKINGTYYVVEAACENKYEKIWVQSAYLTNNKEDVTQVPDAENVTPEMTAETALASPSSNNRISQNKSVVNNKSMQLNKENSEAYNLGVQDIDSRVENGYNNSDTVGGSPQIDITEEQQEQYTAAILRYKSGESYLLNAKIRENIPLDESEQELVNSLDAALLTLPTYEGIVYRQLVFDDFGGQEAFNDFLAQHVPGEPIYYEQYTSCSTTEDGYTVEGKYKVQLIIDGKSARDVNGYGNNMENEVVFSRNVVFIVNKVENTGEYTKIYMQEVIDNGYNTTQEQGDAVLHVQESYFGDGDMQSVPKENTFGNSLGKVRPQSPSSAGQRDTIRAETRQNTLLSTERSKQVNQKADSEESANFMPENSDLQSTAGKDIFGLSAANPQYNPIEDLHYKSVGVERLTADQKKLKKVGERFGAKVLFADLDEIRIDPKTGKEFLFSPEGQFDPDTNTITLNTNVKEYHRPAEYILKHELTHSLEIDADNYALFATQVLRSEAFTEYVRSKGYESADAWAAEIIKQYSGKGVKGYQGSKAQLLANQEMVANFVGDMLFGGRTDITEKLLNSMTATERKGFIAIIKEFFAKLKELFKGTAELTEIEHLENLFLETANKVASNNKTATKGSGDIVYSGDNKFQNDKQYSFAMYDDASVIEQAEQLERELEAQGNMSEAEIRDAIWKEYEIVRDTDGIWIYEINDDGMKFYPNGDYLIKDDPDYKEYMALKRMTDWTEAQADRFAELDDKFLLKYDFEVPILKNYLQHDELYEKYPQLKEAKFIFQNLPKKEGGFYDPETNTIVLNEQLKNGSEFSMNIAILHEIQHAIQKIEGREKGASEEYWNARLLRGGRLPINPETGKEYTPFEAYEQTIGEIEARNASYRSVFPKEWRRRHTPQLGWENSLSAREPVLAGEYDAEYSSAIENGNIQKAQQMVDTAAELFGYTERLYHQTDADFTEFNTNNQKAGKYDWELPTGTFLKPTNDDIGLSGKKQMELYANIKKPLEFGNRYEAQKYWSENIPGYDTAISEVLSIDAKYRSRVDAAVDAIQHYSKEWRQKHPKESRRAIYNDAEYQRLSDNQADIIEEWESVSNKASLKAKKLIDSYIAKSDYDGIIVEHDKDGENRETKSYIVFSSAQLKSAAPVTYDDSGNVISLSQRFNENQSDIRYSISETNSQTENYNLNYYQNLLEYLTEKEYNILTTKKPIKVRLEVAKAIESTRTQRYAKLSEEEIPILDIINLGEYNTLNSNDYYFIRNANKYDFSVIKHSRTITRRQDKYVDFKRRQRRNKIDGGFNSNNGSQGAARANDKSDSYNRSSSYEQASTTDVGLHKRGDDTYQRIGFGEGFGNIGDEIEVLKDRRGLTSKKYSLPSTVDIDSVIEAVERGEMSASEAKELLGRKILNPTEIANLPKETADITLIQGKAKREGTGDKESKFYESALKSKIITDDVKSEIENDTYIKNYHSTTNKRTLKMAMHELDEGGYTRVNEFFNLKPEKGSAVDVAVGFILLERYQRANMTEDALRVAEKLREIGTLSGQTVQMFSVLGRFTPEMMVEYAAKELKKAYEDMVKTKSQAWIDKNKTKFELTREDIVFIKNNILFASELEESRQKAILLAEVCTRIQNKIPPEMGQSLRAWQRISLLLNPKTNIRNILGNTNMAGVYVASDFFGNLIDKQIAKKTGVRTTGNYHIKGSGTALKKGLYESYDDFKRGIRTKQDELNRYEVNQGGGKSFNEQHKGPLAKQLNAVAKALNTLDNFTSFCLEAGDRPFFEMWFVNSLNNQMRLNDVEIPTPAMMEIARLEAEQRTWQDSNMVSRSMSKIKRVLNRFHIPATSYGFGDFVLKFVKTPANIAKAMVEFSPIGLATAGSKAVNFKNALSRGEFDASMQKEVVRSMSSAITGTILYVLVAAGMALGTIELSGSGDDDKDVSNFEKYIVGIPPYSMKIFGQNVTYSWNQPVGVILATVADFMENKEDGISAPWYEDLLGAFKTGTAVFTEQSFLSSLYELFSAEDLATGIFDAVLSEPSAFFPQFVSQIASFTDPYRRTTYHKGNAWKTALNGIIYKIPGLRQILPEQVNVLGETSENTQYLNPWEAFISPGNTYPESSGAVAEEIYELYKLTGNNAVMPRTAPYSYTVKGETVSLTPEERAEFQRLIGTESVRILKVLFNSADYKALTDEQKSDAVKKVYDYAYDKAKSQKEYKYETVAAMSGGEKVLPKEKWNKLSSQAKQALIDDYFFTNQELKCKGDDEKLVVLFIKKSKE